MWSPDGRYFAYKTHLGSGSRNFPLRIFSAISRQHLNTDFVAVDFDRNLGLNWSPDGNRLAIWIVGNLLEFDTSDPAATRTLLFFDTMEITDAFLVADPTYSLGPHTNIRLWSPDSAAFVFIDRNGFLVHINIETQVVTILDDHVHELIAWSPVTDIESTPTSPAGQSITSFTLANAATDTDIGPLMDGITIDLAVTGSSLNVRANTSPSTVGSVRFGLDGSHETT